MAFQPIPKEKWLQMSQEEKDWATLEFKKDIEKRRTILLYLSRIAAIVLILVMAGIWYTNLTRVQVYSNLITEHGPDAWCYMCGQESLKKCECSYDYSTYSVENATAFAENMAHYNIQQCKPIYTASETMMNSSMIYWGNLTN
jgi:hypothetical protein